MTALEKMNHSFILDKEIRVMWSNRDPDARRSGVGNVFIKVKKIIIISCLSFCHMQVLIWYVINWQNFSDHIDNVILQELFSKFGEILSCKVARNEDGTSRGYGFVQFAAQESADIAIENLNNSYFEGKQL
jgi:polyadenylate-binding protein